MYNCTQQNIKDDIEPVIHADSLMLHNSVGQSLWLKSISTACNILQLVFMG